MGSSDQRNANSRRGDVEVNPVVILDTSAVIRLFKGTSREIGRAVMNSRNLIIPLAAYAEFLAGIERGGRTAQRERELMEDLRFFKGFSGTACL